MGNGTGVHDEAEHRKVGEYGPLRADGGFVDHELEDGNGQDGSTGEGSVAESLLAELEDGTVPREVVEQLGRELRADRSRVLDVRVRQLTQDVEELRAYTAALEEFIDEHGTAEQVLSSVRDEAQDLKATVERMDGELDRVDTTLAARGDRLERIVNALEVLGEDVEELSARTDDISVQVDDVAERVDERSELREDVSTLSDALRSESKARQSLASEVDALRSRVEDQQPAELAERVDDLEDRLDDVSEQVGALADETAAVRSELDALGDWVTRIRGIFDSLAADDDSPAATSGDADATESGLGWGSDGPTAGDPDMGALDDDGTVTPPIMRGPEDSGEAVSRRDPDAREDDADHRETDSSFSIDLEIDPETLDTRLSTGSETNEETTGDDPERTSAGESDADGSVANRVGEFVIDLESDADEDEPSPTDADGESGDGAERESAADDAEDGGFDWPS